jgi:hypothetical protein
VVSISRVLRLTPAAALVLGLAACASDDPDGSGGTRERRAAASSAPETPSVVPTTGKEISVETVSMRLTNSPDWTMSQTTTTVVANLPLGTDGILGVTVQDVLTTSGDDTESMAVAYERTMAAGSLRRRSESQTGSWTEWTASSSRGATTRSTTTSWARW